MPLEGRYFQPLWSERENKSRCGSSWCEAMSVTSVFCLCGRGFSRPEQHLLWRRDGLPVKSGGQARPHPLAAPRPGVERVQLPLALRAMPSSTPPSCCKSGREKLSLGKAPPHSDPQALLCSISYANEDQFKELTD